MIEPDIPAWSVRLLQFRMSRFRQQFFRVFVSGIFASGAVRKSQHFDNSMSEDQSTVAAALQIQKLSYSYGESRSVLSEIEFSVAEGERVALVGPSGAGKSTLLMHLNGLLPDRLPGDSDRASVVVSDIAIRKSSVAEVRRLVGFVFQDPDDQLFCPTVREDVGFGPLNLGLPREEVFRRIAVSLDQVGLAGFENRSTLQLSTGERKRVCLAGVLACHPELLVLDEPFANLDSRARRSLVEILREFSGSQVIATHDLDFVVELCDRVIILDEGQIKADGPVREILSDELLIAEHGLEVPWGLRAEG